MVIDQLIPQVPITVKYIGMRFLQLTSVFLGGMLTIFLPQRNALNCGFTVSFLHDRLDFFLSPPWVGFKIYYIYYKDISKDKDVRQVKLGSIQNIVMPHRLKSKYFEFAFSWTHISKTLCVDLQIRTVWNIMMRKSEKEILWMWQTHLTCLKTISKNSPQPMLPFLSLSTLL